MPVCPWCKRRSNDPEFCDHCNREITAGSGPAAPPASIRLQSGRTLACSGWPTGWPADPESSVSVHAEGSTYRLHGISPARWPEFRQRVEQRAACRLSVLPPVELVEADGGVVVVVEAWQGRPNRLLAPGKGSLRDGDLRGLDDCREACRELGRVLAALHEAGLVWLTFDPARLEIREGQMRITNLDLGVYTAGTAPDRLRISRRYSPPEVCRFVDTKIGPSTDVYHLAAYAYYHLTGLLPEGFAGRGLEAFEFRIPSLRIFQPHMPLGIGPVIERGLAKDPARRHPSIEALLEALDSAIAGVKAQQASAVPVAWEIGGLTRTGRSKTALGLANQDRVYFGPLPPAQEVAARRLGSEAWLLIVADGVTNSRIGSGDMASETGSQALTQTLAVRWPRLAGPHEIESALIESCVEASARVFHQALALITPDSEVRDCDVMSSTAVIGLLQGATFHLANLGDSRAYLVRNGSVEQLTVDGDVASVAMADGVPPETVLNLGAAGRAIARCLGACREDNAQGLMLDVERSSPLVTRWHLLPGDLILLCSDGLIEEGAFLEPGEAAQLALVGADLPVQAVAERLVSAADSRQREPSPEEPKGYGDNISCILVRVTAARTPDSPA